MFFVLSKLFHYLLQPLTWIALVLIAGLIWQRYAHKTHWSAVILLLFFSNEYIANQAIRWLEAEPVYISDIQKQYEYGVVLTGMTHHKIDLPDRTQFGEGVDRITDAIVLYREGIVEKILISGGGAFLYEDYVEAEELRAFLWRCSIPDTVIVLEKEAKNTYENARNTIELFKRKGIQSKPLIITSAFHMVRTKACFEKAGLMCDYFPTDFISYPAKLLPEYFFPSSEALVKWNIILKEIFGLGIYKLMGYA
jgi:uncharacterized SAM-binding protein YcdF (DUF218 family)